MYPFTKPFMNPSGSPIRELHKHVGKPGMLSFAAGYPDSALFDVEGLQSAEARAYQDSSKCLQYGATEGLPSLRNELQQLMLRRGSACSGAELLVTTGSQQGLDLLLRVLIAPGDTVLVEQPTYPATLQALRLQQAEIMTTPIDADGLQVGVLETFLDSIRTGRPPKLLYTVATFGNPSGATLTEPRRLTLLRLAVKHRFLIIEDDPYGELRFIGEPVPSLIALAAEVPGAKDWLVHLSSLSKTAAGGLRIGWMAGPAEIIRRCTIAKQTADLCTSPWSQATAAEYIASGDFERHIPDIARAYANKCAQLCEALTDTFKDEISFDAPAGGMFLWVRFPKRNAGEILEHALAHNVMFVPGHAFFHDNVDHSSLRLSFAGCNEGEIAEGVRRLRLAVNQASSSQPAAAAAYTGESYATR